MDFEGQEGEFLHSQKGIGYIYELDHDFVCIQRHHKPEFYEFFQKALDSYTDGDWVNAQSNLASCKMMLPYDGPMTWMSDYMESAKNLPPETWKGVRDLDVKQEAPDNFGMDETKPRGSMLGLD